jgi:hypothetical protein
VISHPFAFDASRYLSILVSMLDLSPPLPVFLLLRVGGLSRLNTLAVVGRSELKFFFIFFIFFFINRAWLNQNSMSIKTSLTKLTINFNLT